MNKAKSKSPPIDRESEEIAINNYYVIMVNKLLESVKRFIADNVSDETERAKLIDYINSLITQI